MGLSLKSLLPVAGAAAGFFLGPAGIAAVNAALGSGIGTLLAGGDLKDAVKNSAMAGLAGSGLQAAGVGSTAAQAGSSVAAQTVKEKALMDMVQKEAVERGLAKEIAKKGIASYLTPGNVLLGSTLVGGLLAEEPEQPELTEEEKRMIRTGERTAYVGQDVVPRYDYSQAREINGILYAAQGGFIEGPGTGTSDDIPAMIYQNGSPVQEARLSDGEFVMTERAVAGAGGPARMYQMMKQYEAMA